MTPDEQRPRVGVGVLVMKGSQILFGKRMNAHGEGAYATPGGHLEYMESFEECARREVREETGMEIQNVRFLYIANLTRYAPKHFAHIGLVADWKWGEPQNLEPNKCEGWDWYELDRLPDPIMYTNQMSLEAYRTGHNYFDADSQTGVSDEK